MNITSLLAKIIKNVKPIVYCLAALYFLAGTVYSIEIGNNLRYPDENEYYTLSENLYNVHQYTLDGKSLTAYRPPVYPLFLAFLKFLGFSIILMRIVNFALLALIFLIVHKLFSSLTNDPASLIFLILIIGYPVIFYTAGTLYPQILITFFIVLILYLLFNNKDFSLSKSILAGILFGLLALTSPILISTIFVIFVWIYFAMLRHKIKALTIIFVVFIGIISIWTIRNYLAFNRFVLISTNGGINLLLGNSEYTGPNSGINVNIGKYEKAAGHFNEIEKDNYYRNEALKFILHNKKHSIVLYIQKVLNYFNYKNKLYVRSESSSLRNLIMLISYGILLLLFLFRLFLFKQVKMTNPEKLVFIIYISNAFFSALFFTRIRFRIPFDILLIIGLSIFLLNFVKKYKYNLFSKE